MEASRRILERFSAGDRIGQLERYAEWLVTEAGPAGGLGPQETERIDQRHLADSLAMAEVWWPHSPQTLLDLGSGVGLPGIPLAILHRETAVTLIDRSGRRATLLRRAIRILGLENATVIQTDIALQAGRFEVVVARGVAEPLRLLPDFERLVSAPGWAVVAGSRSGPPAFEGFQTEEVGRGILDPPGWVLIMDRSSRRTE